MVEAGTLDKWKRMNISTLQMIPYGKNTTEDGQKSIKFYLMGSLIIKIYFLWNLACIRLWISQNMTQISLTNKKSHWLRWYKLLKERCSQSGSNVSTPSSKTQAPSASLLNDWVVACSDWSHILSRSYTDIWLERKVGFSWLSFKC